MLARLWRELDLADAIHLEINSIGDAAERRAHRIALVDYFTRHAEALDADSRRRLATNPLRILDSKNPALQEIIAGAPRLVDRLELPARTHFDGVMQLLADAGIAYTVNPRLVRGLDYYNRTVFEWVTDRLGAQGTVAGGGRYDGLFEELGGKSTPACGFAMGVERMILLLQIAKHEARDAPFAYLVHVGDSAAKLAHRVAEQLRDAGHPIVMNAGGGSFKAQMKRADASVLRSSSAMTKPRLEPLQSSRCASRGSNTPSLRKTSGITLSLRRIQLCKARKQQWRLTIWKSRKRSTT
jgi:histidyl-tRNA synthetase